MAKVNYTENLGDLGNLRWEYVPDAMHTVMEESGDKKAVYLDDEGGGSIILKGKEFAYLDGELLVGKVEKIVFLDEDGDTLAKLAGGDFKAKQLGNLLESGASLYDFLDKIYSGKDTFTGTENRDFLWAGKGNDNIFGLGGADSLNGEAGNDRMTGGAGSDFFFFMNDNKGGHDVVTDFDAKGGDDKQDYVEGSIDDVVSIKQVGDDLVLDYGGGNTLTLRDVDKSDFDSDDFQFAI